MIWSLSVVQQEEKKMADGLSITIPLNPAARTPKTRSQEIASLPVKSTCARVKEIALAVAKVAGHVFFVCVSYIVFPNVVVIGFTVGVIFDKGIQRQADKIQAIWKNMHPALKAITAVGVGLVCFFAPITWPGIVFIYTAYLGSKASLHFSKQVGWDAG